MVHHSYCNFTKDRLYRLKSSSEYGRSLVDGVELLCEEVDGIEWSFDDVDGVLVSSGVASAIFWPLGFSGSFSGSASV